jgi:AcrR family transcriptional regulator
MPASTIAPADASDLVLEAGDKLFYERGIRSVSVGEIRDLSGVSMRRIYSMFGSKDDLVAAWLSRRHETWMADFGARVDSRLSLGRAPVDAIFDALASWLTATSFRGCGFINTQAEIHDLPAAHRRIIQEHKVALADYLDSIAGNGKSLVVLVDGAIVQSAIFQTIKPVEAARDVANASG